MHLTITQFFRKQPRFKSAIKYKENVRNSLKLQKLATSEKNKKWHFLKRKKTCYTLAEATKLVKTTHSLKRLKRVFAAQWQTKQLFKEYYQILVERHWQNHFKAQKKITGTQESFTTGGKNSLIFAQRKLRLIQELESRLDVVIWKARFVPTLGQARQLIKHGFVTVNNTKALQIIRVLKPNDVVQIKINDSAKTELFKNLEQADFFRNFNRETTPYNLEISYKNSTVIYINKPTPEYIQYPFLVDITLL